MVVAQAKLSDGSTRVVTAGLRAVEADPKPPAQEQPPRITTEPGDLTLPYGRTGNFAVAASGKVTGYRWQQRQGSTWSDVPGGTRASLTVKATTPSQQGMAYRVVVSGAGGTVTSRTAVLKLTKVSSSVLAAWAVSTKSTGSVLICIASPGVVPMGTVTAYDGTKVLGRSPVLFGVAALKLPKLAKGEHRLRVEYSGSDMVAAGASPPTKVVLR